MFKYLDATLDDTYVFSHNWIFTHLPIYVSKESVTN